MHLRLTFSKGAGIQLRNASPVLFILHDPAMVFILEVGHTPANNELGDLAGIVHNGLDLFFGQ